MLGSWIGRLIGVFLLFCASASVAGEAIIVELTGAIGPATSDYVSKSIHEAESRAAAVVVLRMDTPGGLDTSMREIIKSITASSVPVVGYVAPAGSRAASAGTYILYACHIAAMAPGTNLGAATPVAFGGLPDGTPETPMPAGEDADEDADAQQPPRTGDAKRNKIVNDAVAYLRSLAQLRGRDAEWAEKAVREAASLPAEEALAAGVIDLIAPNLDRLLEQIDGRLVGMPVGKLTLQTADLVKVELTPDWHSRLLSIISNPNVAYILLLVGIYGLVYEFSNPGVVLPGTVGAVCLVLALYSLHLLPINYAGAALMLLGIALMVSEAFVPSFGALGLGGVAAFVVGSLILVDTDVPGFGLSIPLILGFAVVSALLLFTIIGMAVQSRRRPVVSGAEELIGAVGIAVSGFPGDGRVRVHGEIWSARSGVEIAAGEGVHVIDRDGLILLVAPGHCEEVRS